MYNEVTIGMGQMDHSAVAFNTHVIMPITLNWSSRSDVVSSQCRLEILNRRRH